MKYKYLIIFLLFIIFLVLGISIFTKNTALVREGLMDSNTQIYNINSAELLCYHPFNIDFRNYAVHIGTSDGVAVRSTISTDIKKLSNGSLFINGTNKPSNNTSNNNTEPYFNLKPITLKNTGLTISCWVYYNMLPNQWVRLFDFGNGAEKQNIGIGFPAKNQLYFFIRNNGNSDLSVDYTFVEKTWYNITVTIQPNGFKNIYINNILVKSGAGTYPSLSTIYNNYIGKSNWSGDGYPNCFYNNFIVFNRAITDIERGYLYDYSNLISFDSKESGPIKPSTTLCIFDPIKYNNFYPDLDYAFKSDIASLKSHWLTWGMKEGRTPCGTNYSMSKFDALKYENLYVDLKTAFNGNVANLTKHYIDNGIRERRAIQAIPLDIIGGSLYGKTRFIKITISSPDTCIQISQLAVYDSNNSIIKPITATGSELSGGIAKPNNAIDGILSARGYPNIYHSLCQPGDYFELDLGKEYDISKIVYYNRMDCCQTRAKDMTMVLMDESKKTIFTFAKFTDSLEQHILFRVGSSSDALLPAFMFKETDNTWYSVIPYNSNQNKGIKKKWSELGILSNADMTISFVINVSETRSNWRNILHVTNTGKDCCDIGNRTPTIWIKPNDTILYICSSTNTDGNVIQYTTKLPLDNYSETLVTMIWSNRTIIVYFDLTEVLKFIYNDDLFIANPSAEVYLGHPIHVEQGGFKIKDFKLFNGSVIPKKTLSSTSPYALPYEDRQPVLNGPNYANTTENM